MESNKTILKGWEAANPTVELPIGQGTTEPPMER